MREFKFRVWNESFDRMFYFTFDNFIESNIINSGNVGTDVTEFIVMQSTNLLDKNKKEIYEGDILLEESTGKNKIVGWNSKLACFEVTDDNSTQGCIILESSHEVIGNIYEHPELLKSKIGLGV